MTVSTSRRKQVVRGIILSLTSFLLTLVLIEVLLRLFAPQYQPFTQPDALLGYSYIPYAHYWFVPPEGCAGWGSSGTINSQGLIDREHDFETPPGVFRILALGDSQTEGLQFDRSLRWTSVLETELNENGGKYEIINGARSGMGPTLEYLYYTERGRKYGAKLVILNMTYNDFADDSPVLQPDLRPYFVLKDGELALDNSFQQQSGYQAMLQSEWARQNFLVVSFVRERLSYLRQAQSAQQLQAVNAPAAPSVNTPADAPTTQDYADAIDVTLKVLQKLNDEVKADGAEFVVFVGSAPVDQGFLDVLHERYPEHPNMTVNDLLAQFGEENGIRILPIEKTLSDWAEAHNMHPAGCAEGEWSGHWNPASQAQVALMTLEYLQREKLLPQS